MIAEPSRATKYRHCKEENSHNFYVKYVWVIGAPWCLMGWGWAWERWWISPLWEEFVNDLKAAGNTGPTAQQGTCTGPSYVCQCAFNRFRESVAESAIVQNQALWHQPDLLCLMEETCCMTWCVTVWSCFSAKGDFTALRGQWPEPCSVKLATRTSITVIQNTLPRQQRCG